MKISAEQFAKIVEEEAVNVLKEVWQPSQTAAKIADKYARLQTDKKSELSLGTDKEKQQTPPEEKERKALPPLKSISGTELQKQLKILMAKTKPILLIQLRPLIKGFVPEILSSIVKRAKIDTSLFEKDLINFIDKLEQYSSIALKEDLKQDIERKRKLIANIDKVMSNVRNEIFLKLSQYVEKNIDGIREDIIEYISENRQNIGEVKAKRLLKLLSQDNNKWLLDNLKQDIMAVSNSLVLITKQTILNAYSQKEIPE
jgi:hypothetical protein